MVSAFFQLLANVLCLRGEASARLARKLGACFAVRVLHGLGDAYRLCMRARGVVFAHSLAAATERRVGSSSSRILISHDLGSYHVGLFAREEG